MCSPRVSPVGSVGVAPPSRRGQALRRRRPAAALTAGVLRRREVTANAASPWRATRAARGPLRTCGRRMSVSSGGRWCGMTGERGRDDAVVLGLVAPSGVPRDLADEIAGELPGRLGDQVGDVN